MSKNFSFRRLLLLIKKQWIENVKFYLFGALALLGLLGIVFLFWIDMGGNRFHEGQLIIIFFVGLFLSGAIFASTSFNMSGNKAKGMYWLSFPASHLEKLICMIFYNLVVFTVVYCICFFFIEQIAVSYVHHLIESNPTKYSFTEIDWSRSSKDPVIIRYFVYAFLAVQALYLLGSIYFRRYAFILTTIITAFVFFCFILFVQNLLSASSFGFSINTDDVLYVSKYQSGLGYKQYELNTMVSNIFIFLVRFIWAPFFWLVTWFRLKEKEI